MCTSAHAAPVGSSQYIKILARSEHDVGLEKIKTEKTPHPHRESCNVPQTELSATPRHRASDCKKRTRRIIVQISSANSACMKKKSSPRTPKPIRHIEPTPGEFNPARAPTGAAIPPVPPGISPTCQPSAKSVAGAAAPTGVPIKRRSTS